MSRRLLPLLLFGLLGLAVVSGAVSAGSGGPPPVWGSAIEVPGTDNPDIEATASVDSVSCGAPGVCAAGGFYTDGSDNGQAFVVDETNGTWGNAIEVPGTATLNHDGAAGVTSVSCGAAGVCAGGGSYLDGSGRYQAFVVDEASGSWGNAIEVPGTAALNRRGDAEVESVSCATAGNCAAGGYYRDGSRHYQAFVVDETNGSWGNAIEVPGTATLNKGSAEVGSVSCAAVGECAAGGFYHDAAHHQRPFVVSEKHGHWTRAIEVPGTATFTGGNSNSAAAYSVSCATAGNCAAAISGGAQAHVVNETNGVWHKAIEVPGIATLNKGHEAETESVSCAAAGACVAGGYYNDGREIDNHIGPYNIQAFVVSERHGRWGRAVEAPGTAALNTGGGAVVSSVSCAATGACAAGGYYTELDPLGEDEPTLYPFVMSSTHGSWSPAVEVAGDAYGYPGDGDYLEVNSISCATPSACAAGGFYGDPDGLHAWVVSSAPPPSLNAGETICNGTYAGTGDHVIVPAGDTCTLVPSTHVTGNVTVAKGGTLYATGVTIDGVLELAGSATLCDSKVLSDAKAVSPGGSLELGGRSCVRGNTFSRNVVVKNDRHDVRIRRNTVAGNLILLYDHGRTDSIRDNTVANLVVAHSGPVVVSGNHATGTIRCIANEPQHGGGNTARGQNTCPK